MITLSKLLEVANTHAPDSTAAIDKILGDPYLYFHNPIFQNMRDQALAFGYSYSDADGALWRDYQVFALVTLPRILELRQIPFIDNASVISALLNKHGDFAVPPHFLLTALKKNYLLHESAHAVSNGILRQQDFFRLEDRTDEERFVMESFLCESFANTMEKLASAVAHENVHALLFTLNSYILFNRGHLEHLRNALRDSSAKSVFVLGFLFFYASNSFGVRSELDRDRIVSMLVEHGYIRDRVEAAHLWDELSSAGFDVNPDFRDETTPIYFKICGYGQMSKSRLQELNITHCERNLMDVFRAAQLFAQAQDGAFNKVDETARA